MSPLPFIGEWRKDDLSLDDSPGMALEEILNLVGGPVLYLVEAEMWNGTLVNPYPTVIGDKRSRKWPLT